MAPEHSDTLVQQPNLLSRTPGMSKPREGKFNISAIEEREYSDQEKQELTKLYDQTFGSIHENEIVKGRIVAITDNAVAIDIGFKSEGLVPITEFPNIDELRPGDEVEVFLESVENKDGQLVLSRKRADFMRIWERVTKSMPGYG